MSETLGYGPIHPGSGRPPLRKRVGHYLAPVVLLAAKAKTLLILLPNLKLLATFDSMAVSIAAYSLLFGLPFAVGFVLLLLLHELGRVFQLRREGIKASAPIFIPFLGAVIASNSLGKDAAAEARVGLAGPVLGTLATANRGVHLVRIGPQMQSSISVRPDPGSSRSLFRRHPQGAV